MEHCMFKHIMNHCEKHIDVITDVQHKFHQKQSCESQLLETVDDLAFNIDQADICHRVSFSKAFDTVLPLPLMSKLDHLSI